VAANVHCSGKAGTRAIDHTSVEIPDWRPGNGVDHKVNLAKRGDRRLDKRFEFAFLLNVTALQGNSVRRVNGATTSKAF